MTFIQKANGHIINFALTCEMFLEDILKTKID